MKFAIKFLAAFADHPEWVHIDYDMLKECIAGDSQSFHQAINSQITAVNHFFEMKRTATVDTCNHQDAEFLRKWQILNYLAVLKACKKHDKNYPTVPSHQVLKHLMCQPFIKDLAHEPALAIRSVSKTCPVCCDGMTNPFSLKCGHEFCYSCLKNCYAHKHTCCPLCRCEQTLDPVCQMIDSSLDTVAEKYYPRFPEKASRSGSDWCLSFPGMLSLGMLSLGMMVFYTEQWTWWCLAVPALLTTVVWCFHLITEALAPPTFPDSDMAKTVHQRAQELAHMRRLLSSDTICRRQSQVRPALDHREHDEDTLRAVPAEPTLPALVEPLTDGPSVLQHQLRRRRLGRKARYRAQLRRLSLTWEESGDEMGGTSDSEMGGTSDSDMDDTTDMNALLDTEWVQYLMAR